MTAQQRSFFLLLSGWLLAVSVHGQRNKMVEHDKAVTTAYRQMKELFLSASDEQTIAKAETKFLQLLSNPHSFFNPFDSLSKEIGIVRSADSMVRFYNWESGGGSWHSIVTYAQYRVNRQVKFTKITTASMDRVDYTDSNIYEVFNFMQSGHNYYITIGWGTHGSGMQHNIIRLFTINNGKLVKCSNCLPGNNDLIFEYPRTMKMEISFDNKKIELTYNRISNFSGTRYYGDPGVVKDTLVWANGKFVSKY